MGERALRGSRLGTISYEVERNIELAPRKSVRYDCVHGHSFAVTFSDEAEIPALWECTYCGGKAEAVDGVMPEAKKGKPPRTHWDMLLERRSVEDLEVLLEERLEVLHARRGDRSHKDHRKSA